MADLATLQTRLTEAETALHDLAIGARVVEVRRDGKTMRYSDANKAALESYIADLKAEIAVLEGDAADSLPRRRFIPVAFR